MILADAKETHTHPYTDEFFRDIEDGSRQSAETIVPLLIDLVNPKSVLDVGCGTGMWLAVFRERGVSDLLGIDGEYVRPERLQIDRQQFVSADLQNPIDLGRRFDLVLCLEVAEHLPADCAAALIGSLVGLAPVVLFSAAIPGQGGNHHINEQWPSYWVGLFRDKGYVPIDCIRPRIWNNEKIEWWYAQNALMFVSQNHLTDYPALIAATQFNASSLVHPGNFETALARLHPENMSVRQVLGWLPIVTWHAIKRRLRKTST